MYPTMQLYSLLIALATWVGYAFGRAEQVARPQLPSCSTRSTVFEPQLFPDLNSDRIKVSYGPFSVPSRSDNHGMQNFVCSPDLPCRDCMIVSMHAGLEYPNGSIADAGTGMWLHHTVFQNLMREDAMCGHGQRFFASGNERTPVDLSSNGENHYGYRLDADDQIVFGFEAMNMKDEKSDVMLTVTWEYVSAAPNSFKELTPYWFDVGGCRGSEQPAQPASTFTYSSKPVKAPTSGVIAFTGGHLHDGGTYLELLRQGEPYCTSQAQYKNGHIVSIGTCQDLRYMKGDNFSIVAHYDTSKHTPMAHPDGELEPVMGIALVYALEERGNKKHLARNIILISFFTVVISAGASIVWLRVTKTGVSSILPDHVRRRFTGYRIALDDQLHRFGVGSSIREPLLEGQDSGEYRD